MLGEWLNNVRKMERGRKRGEDGDLEIKKVNSGGGGR